MADEEDSKSFGGDTVRVQVPQPALLGRGKGQQIRYTEPAVPFSLPEINFKVRKRLQSVILRFAAAIFSPLNFSDGTDGFL